MGRSGAFFLRFADRLLRAINQRLRGVAAIRKKLKKRLKRWSIAYVKNVSRGVLRKEDLLADLSKCTLRKSDRVMVHSSLSSMGVLENGAETFVAALKELISSEGTIVMPTFPQKNMYEYLSRYEVFEVTSTQSQNGAITETFRLQEGTFRSLHPTHPVAAWGKDAEELCAGHERSLAPFGERSPYAKILAANFKILLVGVNFEHMTICRAFEDLRPEIAPNPYLDQLFAVEVRNAHGNLVKVTTKCHSPDFSRRRYNMYLYAHMKNRISVSRIGSARTTMVLARDVFDTQVELAKRGIFGYHAN
jgi:aminoglycoside N3'-acetyltransferase